MQNHPYQGYEKKKKKEEEDRVGSDLSYHFLEAEANSADSMVKQFNYLSMLELHSMVKQYMVSGYPQSTKSNYKGRDEKETGR